MWRTAQREQGLGRQEIAAGSEGQRTRLLHRDELSMMGDDVGEALRMRPGGH